MDPQFYKPIFLHLVVLLSLFSLPRTLPDTMNMPLKSNKGNVIFAISTVFILWLGLREINIYFGDTVNYAKEFMVMETTIKYDINSDRAFYYIMSFFAKSGLGIHFWFLFVEFFYFAGTAIMVNKFFTNQPLLVFAVVLASFSFYTYGVNGIRNGMACSLFFLMLAFVKDKKWVYAMFSALFAVNVHSSLYLIVTAFLLARYYKQTKVYMVCWIACIVLSIVASGFFENVFQNQGLLSTGKDAAYMSNDNADMDMFSKTGFRYDFLLYSCVPIIVGYYYVVKQHFEDEWYKLLLNTYIITNSVWVLVNKSWLSNRMAYLSWFMYGIVLMYPLLMNPYVKGRKSKVTIVVVGNAAFSYIMWIIGKY